ncbi:MAG: type IV secretion protein Rhs [Herpetosiphonaceae bacterium]|nr:MAG: type IV secretion protein Rhs [Herpetosiphonaceae bacterium]
MTTEMMKHYTPSIKVGGSDISSISIKDGTGQSFSALDLLLDFVVEDDLAQPAMFALRFLDPEMKLMDSKDFDLGKEVTIGILDTNNTQSKILDGEITALEPEFEQGRVVLVARGYDKSHRLYRGRKTRTFLNKTDSKIASDIAQEAGLSADVQATSAQHAYVIQNNQTDMEFLRDRAARIGYRVVVEGKKLKFRKAETSPSEAPEQEWGKTLLSFNVRLSAVAQVDEVQVRSWDSKAKQAIVGNADSSKNPSKIGDGKTGGDAAKTAFSGAAKLIITDTPVGTEGEAKSLAQAALDELGGDYISAEGVCLGEPKLKAGKTVKINGVGKKFGGTYFVTATRHVYRANEGYFTTFWVNGRRPSSVIGALNGSGGNGHHSVGGVVVGIVTNVNDPDSLGRVKVKFPWLDEKQESDWAWLAMPGAGNQRGLCMLPEVDDQVLVAFEHGDMRRPFVIGGLWSSKDKLPITAQESGKVKIRGLKTRAGHIIQFDEDDGGNKGIITIQSASGNLVVKISDTDKGIEVKSQKHSIKLDDQGQAVKIQSGGTLEITASGNTLKFTQQGVELTGSGGALKIAAQGVELTSQANLNMKANAMATFEANAIMTVKTSAILNIQGSLVKIN